MNWRKFSKFFINTDIKDNIELMSRPEYSINKWLLNPVYHEELSADEISRLNSRIMSIYVSDFFKSDIYKNSKPNAFAQRTLMNPVYINSNNIERVYILSRNITKEQDESKRKFIEKYFNNPKIEYISVARNESKADVMQKVCPGFDLFVDDELHNIRTVAEKFQSLSKKEFLIPDFGYNKMPLDLKLLIEGKGGIITYYNPFVNNKDEN